MVIDHGRVIAQGTADELKAQVGGERLEITVADRGQLRGRRELLEPLGVGHRRGRRAHAGRLPVPVTGGAAVLVEALRRLDAARRRRSTTSACAGPTLDDVFLTLTGHAAEPTPRRDRPARSARTAATPARRGDEPMSAVRTAVTDGVVVAKRNLIKIKRVPDLLVFSTLSPIMFVLLFAYVFGGAIDVAGRSSYREFLIAGHLRPDRRSSAPPSPAPGWPTTSEGHHRPVPVAADVPVGGAGRAHRLPTWPTTCSSSS